MNTLEHRLREAIRKKVRKYLEEISTTGNVAGYLTPHAFSGERGNSTHIRRMAKSIGYSLTKHGKRDMQGDTLHENHYYEYRNDTSKLPHQKIGTAIAEIDKQLQMVERVIKMNARLKKEYGIANERLWKRTTHQMTKLEGRLVEMARRLREMRG